MRLFGLCNDHAMCSDRAEDVHRADANRLCQKKLGTSATNNKYQPKKQWRPRTIEEQSNQNPGILRQSRTTSKQLEYKTTQTRFEMVVVLCTSAMRTVANDDNEKLSVCWVRWAGEPCEQKVLLYLKWYDEHSAHVVECTKHKLPHWWNKSKADKNNSKLLEDQQNIPKESKST